MLINNADYEKQTDQTRTRVLISEPGASTGVPYLPYVWAVLKSYYEHGHRAEPGNRIEWLAPIFERAAVPVMVAPYVNDRVDVLGLSCYVWNWTLQCQIAQRIKKLNPDCVVVAGGPEPDYKNPDFFAEHPYIDVVVIRDGEMPFAEIVSRVARGQRAFDDIPGLCLPAESRRAQASTGPAQVPVVFDRSPYLDNTAYLEAIVASRAPGAFSTVLETNHGCPYSCSFCDWGSSTMSKVRRFEMDRVGHEVDWIGRMKIGFVMLVDANFGIFPRDLEIADLINNAKRKYGFPGYLYYSAAKNNPDRSIEVAR